MGNLCKTALGWSEQAHVRGQFINKMSIAFKILKFMNIEIWYDHHLKACIFFFFDYEIHRSKNILQSSAVQMKM